MQHTTLTCDDTYHWTEMRPVQGAGRIKPLPALAGLHHHDIRVGVAEKDTGQAR